MESAGPSADTAAGDIVSILVSADGPYGLVLEPDTSGNALVVREFERLPNGKFGPIQKHGGVHYGDVLFAINDVPLDVIPFNEALAIVNDRNTLKKNLKFMNPREYYRRRRNGKTAVPTSDSKLSFLSSIRKYRFSTDNSGKKFVDYEIACQFRVAGMRVQKDIVYKWNIWKRYSEFEKLHNQLKQSLGWQMEGIEFPPSHTFVLNKLSVEFVEQRREDLNKYWQRVILIDKATEFTKHHCSSDLKEFLDVEETMKNDKLSVPEQADGDNEDSADKKQGVSSSNPNRRSQKTMSVRRRSLVAKPMTDEAAAAAESQSPVSTPSSNQSSAKAAPAPAPSPSPAPAPTPAPTPARAPASAPAPAPAPVAAAPTGPPSSDSLPPKASGARANLLSQINARRVD